MKFQRQLTGTREPDLGDLGDLAGMGDTATRWGGAAGISWGGPSHKRGYGGRRGYGMRENVRFREWLGGEHPGAVLLEPGHCDSGIVGVRGGRVVYDYDMLCESYAKEFRGGAKDDEDALQMGIDWVEFNTLRSLSYMGDMAPIVIMYDPERGYNIDLSDVSEEPSEVTFEGMCPGLGGGE